MATVNYNCPNCGGPLKFNPDKQNFSCEFCMSDFTEDYVQKLYADREKKESEEERREKENTKKTKSDNAENTEKENVEEEPVVYTCPSCGAEVVTTASTAATTCFYCQNPVVLGGRLSGKFQPDKVIPFKLTKKKAIEKFSEMCGKKWFLPKDFLNEKRFEKMTGVYFPYWYIDEQRAASMVAKGEKVRTWTSGRKQYTEVKVFELHRGGDIIVKNVAERALKSENREMLQCVHPFDRKDEKPFAMSFLSGFQAEKRDIEKTDIENAVSERIAGYCQQALKDTMDDYTSIRVQNYNDSTDLESWDYTLLPVWTANYKYRGKIYPFAINGQTGKTYGELPTAKGKLAVLFAAVFVLVLILGLLGGLLLG